MFMKRAVVSLVAMLVIASGGAYAHDMHGMQNGKAAAKGEAAKTMTVKGEIVDMGCYLDHAATGKDHQSCAQKCLANGMPMGLLTKDGTLYLLTVSHENADPFNQAMKLAAEQVSVTGPMMDRNGIKAIEVD